MKLWLFAATLVCAASSAQSAVRFDFVAKDSVGNVVNSFTFVSDNKVGNFSLSGDALANSCYFASGNPCLVAYAVFDSGTPGIAMYAGFPPGSPNYGNPSAVSETRYWSFNSSSGGGPFFYPQNNAVYDFGTYTTNFYGGSVPGLTGFLTISEMAAVPELTTWAMMLGGFGLIGATARREKVSVSFA